LEDRERATSNNAAGMSQARFKRAFGAILRECRLEKGLTQETLGFESGLSRNYVSLVELGQRSPTLDTVEVLAQALGVSASTLIARAERRTK
jgi:transcriptional regulator with XRE-family HTH domain